MSHSAHPVTAGSICTRTSKPARMASWIRSSNLNLPRLPRSNSSSRGPITSSRRAVVVPVMPAALAAKSRWVGKEKGKRADGVERETD